MPRSLTSKGQATRARIVEAAAAAMYTHGVAGTSVEEVRAAAGVSSSQLYHYFVDKSALVRAVIEYQSAAVLALQKPLLARLDTVESLRAWRDTVVAIQRDHYCGCPIGLLANELAEQNLEARADLATSFGLWHEAITDGLRAMQGHRALRDDADPERLALALLAALQGGLLLNRTRRDTVALEAALDAVLELVYT